MLSCVLRFDSSPLFSPLDFNFALLGFLEELLLHESLSLVVFREHDVVGDFLAPRRNRWHKTLRLPAGDSELITKSLPDKIKDA